MIDIDALFRDDPEPPKVAGKPDEAARDICRQAKDRERRLKVAKIRELARESLWRTHLERCRDCKPARPSCPNGKRLWQDYQDAIRGFIRATQIPALPIDADLWERGKRLLYTLWDAGYRLEIIRTGDRYTIIPSGAIHPSAALLEHFDRDHDAAVAVLVETCRRAGIDPTEWHRVAENLETAIAAPEMAHGGPDEADKANRSCGMTKIVSMDAKRNQRHNDLPSSLQNGLFDAERVASRDKT